jgi:Domain of unknown function (DUF4157)/Bacterial SH3 domain
LQSLAEGTEVRKYRTEVPCKVTRVELEFALAQRQPIMSPDAALAYADWLLSEERGWSGARNQSREAKPLAEFAEAFGFLQPEQVSYPGAAPPTAARRGHGIASSAAAAPAIDLRYPRGHERGELAADGQSDVLAQSSAAEAEARAAETFEWAGVRRPARPALEARSTLREHLLAAAARGDGAQGALAAADPATATRVLRELRDTAVPGRASPALQLVARGAAGEVERLLGSGSRGTALPAELADKVAPHVGARAARAARLHREPFAASDKMASQGRVTPALLAARLRPGADVRNEGDQPDVVAEVLALVGADGPGDPLTADLGAGGEVTLGAIATRTRVHTSAIANQAAELLGASAFTIGRDIYFAAGAYTPGTAEGDRLLRHELTHVLQYERGQLATGSRAELLAQSSAAEAEARTAETGDGDNWAAVRRRAHANPPARDQVPTYLRHNTGAAASSSRSFAGSGGASFVSRDLSGQPIHEVSDTGGIEPELLEQSDGGEPLPPAIAARMSELLHHDFTHVRLHSDDAAARTAAALGARAFTLGNHIYFDRGQFAPETPSGERLLLHELTHVVQHDEGRLPHADSQFKVSDPGSATEREARAAEDNAGGLSPGQALREPVPAPPAQTTAAGPPVAEIQRAPKDPPATPEAQVAFVREEGLNLRAGPDQKASSLRQMKFGQRVHVLEDSGKGDWLKIAVLGQTGYVYKPRVHFPPKELIAKDPGLTLIKVKPGQTFWGVVKDSYGIQGNESSRDHNIDHFINAIRAVNKPEAFKVKTGVLDDIGNAVVPGRDASDTELIAGTDLWIPSFGVAAQMDVGSGTVTGEVTRYAKKFKQKLDDFGAAARASGKYIPVAIGRNAGEMATGLLQGLIDFALDAAKILAGSTAVGALLGSFFGGVGAVPGAEIGFEIGLWILEYYGLYMLAEMILGVAGKLLWQLGQFIALAWEANGDKAKIEKAGESLAEALGILVSAVLMVAVAYVIKRGAKALSKTKFAQKVGETRLAKWLEERKDKTTTKDPGAKERAATEKLEKEKLEREKAEKEKAEKEKAEKEKAEKEKAEQEKAEKEKAEQEKAEKEKAEQEKAELEKAEKEKLQQEEAGKEKAEQGKLEADAKKVAKEVSGNAAKEEIKPTKYNYESEAASVEAKVRGEAQAAAEQAYKDAVTKDGKTPKKAKEAAQDAAKDKAKEVALAEAERVARVKAQQAMDSGGAFDRNELDSKAQSQLADFDANKTGGEAKRISGEASGMSAKDFNAKMGEEVSAGKCTKKPVHLSSPPPQTMDVYEYPDGTVVRYKPLGDSNRAGPTYSVEVKKDPSLPDLGKGDAAFKVAPSGKALPKGPSEVKNPYPRGSAQYDEFEKAVMNAGHHSLPSS